jgi:long-chain fatty acid transport protein
MVWLVYFLIWLSVWFHPATTAAQAIRFQPQGAAAAGQGNAFSAQADDASAIHFNPAGLTQIDGIQILAGTVLMGGSVKGKTPMGIDVRGDFGGSIVFPPASHGYFSANLGALGWSRLSDITIGLGLTTPYGLNTRYPTDGPFNSAATSSTLPLIDIKPTIAYRVNEQLSFGVSADVYTFASFLGEGHAEQRLVWPGGFGIPPGSSVEFNGKGTGAGFTASMLYTPIRNERGKPLASIGLIYTSQAVLPLNGALLADGAKVADASTAIVLPQIYRGAVALWPIRDDRHEWKLEVDVEYVGWKSLRNLDVRLANGSTLPQPQRWKTVPVIQAGTEYRWLDPSWLSHWDVVVRAGYTRTENPIPDSTFNPGIASFTANTISVGGGVLCKDGGKFFGLVLCGGNGNSLLAPKAIGFDFAYQEWLYEPRSIIENVNPTVNGTYRASVRLGTVSLSMRY